MSAQGVRLGSLRPGDLNNATVFTGKARVTEITRIHVCNTGAGAATFRLFHDDAGVPTFDETTALYWDKNVPAGDVVVIEAQSENSGIMVKKGGQIGVRTNTADDLTFTLYGVPAALPERRSGRN